MNCSTFLSFQINGVIMIIMPFAVILTMLTDGGGIKGNDTEV